MDQKDTLKMAPPKLKTYLGDLTLRHSFKKWDADASWNKSPNKILLINCELSDVEAVSKYTGTPKTTKSNRRIVNINPAGFKLRFRESRKKGRAPDAKTTAMQEAGSKYVFEYALKKKSGWITEEAFARDDKMMEGLREIYSDVDSEWVSVFWKQHKVILNKFGSSKINKFDHEGGFMKEITDIVTKKFKIPKKDNWNPADIWGVRGNSNKVIARVKESIEGSRQSQTILQLNALLRGMYKSNELVGISLKKVSGQTAKWEEYNIEALSLKEIDDYKYKKIDITINFKPTSSSKSLDTNVNLRQSGGGAEYNFQITSNDTSKPDQNLKFESKPVGAAKARGGKAQIKAVEILLKDNDVPGFKDKHQLYPKNQDQFLNRVIDRRGLQDYKQMFNRVSKKANTDCKNADEFVDVLTLIFIGKEPYIATSKLMQLYFLDRIFEISENKYEEFWTDMLFLSIKKGDRFGPFGKLY